MKPINLLAAIRLYLSYSTVIFATWFFCDVDYTNLSGRDAILPSLILRLGLGAAFLAVFIRRLGWWREGRRGRPHWTVWGVGIFLVPFISSRSTC